MTWRKWPPSKWGDESFVCLLCFIATQRFEHTYRCFVQTAFAGCTACVAHVGPDGIHVANAGDCRAVLGVQEADGSWSALPLSWDHNSDNEAEVERIRAMHPPAERDTVVTDGRLLGVSTFLHNKPRIHFINSPGWQMLSARQVLMPLRAFGDVQFKWSLELQRSILASLKSGVDPDLAILHHYTPPNYTSPPYLDATPEIIYHKLRPQDRFLILGTDGLWDELGNKEAVRIVGEHLSAIHLQVCPFFFKACLPLLSNCWTRLILFLSVWCPRLPSVPLRDGWIWVGCTNSWWDAGPAPPLPLTPTLPRTLSDMLLALGTMGSSVRRNWPPCWRCRRTWLGCTGTTSPPLWCIWTPVWPDLSRDSSCFTRTKRPFSTSRL